MEELITNYYINKEWSNNMFLNKFLNDIYLSMLYDNYEEDYINSLNDDNFVNIYRNMISILLKI